MPSVREGHTIQERWRPCIPHRCTLAQSRREVRLTRCGTGRRERECTVCNQRGTNPFQISQRPPLEFDLMWLPHYRSVIPACCRSWSTDATAATCIKLRRCCCCCRSCHPHVPGWVSCGTTASTRGSHLGELSTLARCMVSGSASQPGSCHGRALAAHRATLYGRGD